MNHEHTDASIEQTLAGLGNVDPPAGMAERLAHTLEQQNRTPHSPTHTFWTPRGALPMLLLMLLLMAAVSSLLLGYLAMPLRQTPAPERGDASLHRSASASSLPLGKTQPATLPQTSSVPTSAHVLPAGSARPRKLDPTRTIPENTRERIPVELSAANLAMQEASAPSQPIPPLPLTAEEVRLARIVHGRHQVLLAGLTPGAQLAKDAQDRAAFREFFEPVSNVAHQGATP